METAVSMPDDLFDRAEAAACQLGVSRSDLYATAIAKYLQQQQDSTVTERLNKLYADKPAKLDSMLHRAQVESLEKEVW